GRLGKIIVDWSEGRAQATAFFSGSSTAANPGACHVDEVGPCTVTVCPDPPTSAPGGELASAGTLMISGGSTTMRPRREGTLGNQCEVTAGKDATLRAGAMVQVFGSGGDVPLFGGPSAHMPAEIQVLPMPSTVDFTQDLDVRWTGGGPDGKAVVEILSDGG